MPGQRKELASWSCRELNYYHSTLKVQTKNILVTGACGQLGNEMQLQAALHPQYRWFFTDVYSVSDGSVVVPIDITDRTAVDSFVEENAIDIIVKKYFK